MSTKPLNHKSAPHGAAAFYKAPELATRWKISVRHLYRLISAGELQVTRIGRSLRIPATSVDTFEATHGIRGST